MQRFTKRLVDVFDTKMGRTSICAILKTEIKKNMFSATRVPESISRDQGCFAMVMLAFTAYENKVMILFSNWQVS